MNYNSIVYYENKLDMIIYLLNSTNDENIQMYLLDKYNECYSKYESLIKEVKTNEQTFTTMDWI